MSTANQYIGIKERERDIALCSIKAVAFLGLIGFNDGINLRDYDIPRSCIVVFIEMPPNSVYDVAKTGSTDSLVFPPCIAFTAWIILRRYS